MPLSLRASRATLILWLTIVAAFSAHHAKASPTLSYNIVNLGPMTSDAPIYGEDPDGGLVFAVNGAAWRFNPSSYSPIDTTGLPTTLPTYSGFMDYGNPDNDYHYLSKGYQNASGFTVYTESSGVYGHSVGQTVLNAGQAPFSVDSLAKTIGGTASIPPGGGSYYRNGPGFVVAGINSLNQVLFSNPGYYWPTGATVNLYDSRSGSVVDLAQTIGYAYSPSLTIPLALDEQGRILLSLPRSDGSGTDLLLLSPTDLPIGPVAIPEPSLIAFAACVAAGAVLRTAKRSKLR
ncbi:hypothetical protein [Paludisphaera borealis]|uniref:PEP-CTERM protein-sorting domain-containing protein n=1 Tax=Paludisphaera borealis TaxID=1387353 RepID=A0A1U7CM61_9BACT|nr:hypothetical protein [Paludisphaera borealis]APW60025.1 hypothetical protein BSF38_01487 [Paludisphaera borealis]